MSSRKHELKMNMTEPAILWQHAYNTNRSSLKQKNLGQFRVMPWLLFLKWVGVDMKSFHAAPKESEHPRFQAF